MRLQRRCARCAFEGSELYCPEDGSPTLPAKNLRDIDHPRKGEIIAERYRLLALLGKGGMGEVWFGEHDKLRQAVAVKLIREDALDTEGARARFEREALLISRLQHPHVVRIFDYGYQDKVGAYHIMEYLEGRDLAQIIKDEGPLSIALTIHIAKQIVSALCGAHERGLVHRDLKPANVFIQEDAGINAFAKVLDFGIAKSLEQESDFESITRSGAVIGSPPYMAPEQAMGGELSAQTDLYALGIVLFEMLTAEKPFRGSQPIEILMKHINEEAPQVDREDLPPALRGLIFELLQKSPQARPGSASHVLEILDELEQEVPGRITPTGFKASKPDPAALDPKENEPQPTIKLNEPSNPPSKILTRMAAGFLTITLAIFFAIGDMSFQSSPSESLDGVAPSGNAAQSLGKPEPITMVPSLDSSKDKDSRASSNLSQFTLSLDIRPHKARVMARPYGSNQPFALIGSGNEAVSLTEGRYEIKVLSKNKKNHRQTLEMSKDQTLRLRLKNLDNRAKVPIEPTLPE